MVWLGTIETLVGAFVGVFLALLGDRFVESRKQKGEEAHQLGNAAWSVDENLELARQLREYVASSGPLPILAFRMNTHHLDPAVRELSRLCDDEDLVWSLEHFRFQLRHLNGKLDVMQGFAVKTFRTGTDAEIEGIRNAVLAHVEVILTSGESLVARLNGKLDQLGARRIEARPALELKADEASIT